MRSFLRVTVLFVTTILLPGPHDFFQLLLNGNRDILYNPTRRHSALDYLSPIEYERRYEAGQLTPMEQAALC